MSEGTQKRHCSICGSSSHVQEIRIRRGRETQDMYICQDCRLLVGLGPDTPHLALEIGDFFIPLPDDIDASIACSACGRPLHEIRLSGRVGCETCYFDFTEELQSMKQSDPSQPHEGPLTATLAGLREIFRARHEREQKIAEALQREDYEEAARLRDQPRPGELPAEQQTEQQTGDEAEHDK